MQIQKCLYSTVYDSIRSSTNKLKDVEGEFGEAGKVVEFAMNVISSCQSFT